jgi:tetratricopeptide (TPR) repeat protein
MNRDPEIRPELIAALLSSARSPSAAIAFRIASYLRVLQQTRRDADPSYFVGVADEYVDFLIERDLTQDATAAAQQALNVCAAHRVCLRDALQLVCKTALAAHRSDSALGAADAIRASTTVPDAAAWWAARVTSSILLRRTDFERASTSAFEALHIARHLQRPDLETIALCACSTIMVRTRSIPSAVNYAESAVAVCPSTSARLRDVALWHLGNAHQHAGNLDHALHAFEQAVEAAAQTPSRLAIAQSRHQVGVVLRKLGRVDEARRVFQSLSDRARRDRDALGVAPVWYNLAQIERSLDRSAVARRYFELATARYRSEGRHHAANDSEFYVAVCDIELGQPRAALDRLEGLRPFYADGRAGKELDLVLEAMAYCHEDLGQHGMAARLHQQAAALRESDPSISSAASRNEQPKRAERRR